MHPVITKKCSHLRLLENKPTTTTLFNYSVGESYKKVVTSVPRSWDFGFKKTQNYTIVFELLYIAIPVLIILSLQSTLCVLTTFFTTAKVV